MVLAMACFALEDMAVKRIAETLPVGELLVLFGLGGMAVFAALTRARGERLLHPAMLSRVMLLRAVFEVAGRLFFTLSLALAALSTTSAILQATPLVVAAAGVAFFGERVTPGRWAIIALGFAGVLLVIRPGLDGFTPLSMLALLGMFGFAGRDLATRAAPPILSFAQLGITGFAALVVAGALVSPSGDAWLMPSPAALGWLGFAMAVGVLAYTALTLAMRMGEISVVAPFRYIRLLFAMILAALVFGERPDAAELLGAAVIVGSGVLLLVTSRRRR
ncbi:DMT family transporter [Celeribacter indicus]|nr:DMT family transporter [Celeribacter indicus]